jgi:magnesium chelatase subunit I
LDDDHAAAAALADLKQIQGLLDKLKPLGIGKLDPAPKVVSAAEFFLEGLVAHRKLSRTEERVFTAQEPSSRRTERAELEVEYDDWQRARRTPRSGYN